MFHGVLIKYIFQLNCSWVRVFGSTRLAFEANQPLSLTAV